VEVKRAKILCIDDEEGMREMLSFVLESEGYEVKTADTGENGLMTLEEERFDMVITDMKMPGIDGVEVVKRLKQLDLTIQVIVITGYATLETAIGVLRYGAADYLKKPVNNEDLIISIENVLQKKELEETVSLYDASQIILSKIKLEDLSIVIVESLIKILKADDVSLMLVNEENRLFVAHSYGLNGDIKKDKRLAMGERIIERGPQEKEPVILSGKANEYPLFKGIEEIDDITSAIVCPLYIKNNIIGMLNVNRTTMKEPFNLNDLRKMSIICSQISLAIENAKLYREVEEKVQKLEDAQKQLVHSEKMAAIGQLAAGVAHEINNPIGFINSNLGTLGEYTDDIKKLLLKYEELSKSSEPQHCSTAAPQHLDNIASLIKETEDIKEEIDICFILDDLEKVIMESKDGAERVKKIVMDLKDFSHPDDSELKSANINHGLESTLNIVWNELKYKVTVIKEFGDIPDINCYPHQLNQVFMNILVNGAHAIEEKGEIKISTYQDGDNIIIKISDTGKGIPEEDIPHLFDPFFTTKEVGKGTGLGLSIAYSIIDKHNGHIHVDSTVGKGSTFTIMIPANL